MRYCIVSTVNIDGGVGVVVAVLAVVAAAAVDAVVVAVNDDDTASDNSRANRGTCSCGSCGDGRYGGDDTLLIRNYRHWFETQVTRIVTSSKFSRAVTTTGSMYLYLSCFAVQV
jgi:hypothetical protein